MSQQLTTAAEINPIPDCLDGQCATRHFLGKSLSEAEELFRENSLTYQDDLMWMGLVAFRFYVQAAINYLLSEDSTDDIYMFEGFASTLELRLEYDPHELVPVAANLSDACTLLATDADRIMDGFDSPELDVDRYIRLARRLTALS